MCHLCRKVQALEGVDSKITKSIYHLLAQLHKQVEPHLGDIWLWRLETTTRLRSILTGIHKGIPIAALTALIKDVDGSLEHIRKSMVDHPPVRSVGKLNTLPQKSITPSESTSIRIQKQIELESKKRQKSSGTSNTRDESIRDPKSTDTEKGVERRRRVEREVVQLGSRGSDIDPPKERIEQSIRIVQEGFTRCEALIAKDLEDDDKASMVTITGGGIEQRPKVKDGIWKRLSRVASTLSRTSSVKMSPPTRRSTGKFDDCIYEKPLNKVDLNERIFNEGMRPAVNASVNDNHQARLKSATNAEQAEKLSKEEHLFLKEACRLLELRRKRDEEKYMVRGGRSPGRSAKSSLKALIDGSTGRQNLENATDGSVSLSVNDIQKKVVVGQDKRNSYTSSLLSSRPSPTNLGSLLDSSTNIRPQRGLPLFGRITPVPTGHEPRSISTRSCDSERAVIPRKEDHISRRSRKEDPLVPDQVSRELVWKDDCLVSDRAHRGNSRRQERGQQCSDRLPGELTRKEEHAVSVKGYRGELERKEEHSVADVVYRGDLERNEEFVVSDRACRGERRRERVKPGESARAATIHPKQNGLETKHSDLSIPDYTLERRRRRGEQNRGMSRSDKYRHDERQRLWGHK